MSMVSSIPLKINAKFNLCIELRLITSKNLYKSGKSQ